jgi:hypothetical protein
MTKQEEKELRLSDQNGKDWFDSFQEVESFLLSELEKYGIDLLVDDVNQKPEIWTIKAIKMLRDKT